MTRNKSNLAKIFRHIIFVFTVVLVLGNGIVHGQSTDNQLAFEYFNSNEFDKAAELYKKLYEANRSKMYFNYYIRCLVELEEYKKAEKYIKKQIRRDSPDPAFYVELGALYKKQHKNDNATKQYEEALELISNDRTTTIQLANAFLYKQEYEYAEKTYLTAREKNKREKFHLELANIYSIKRDSEKMLDEYLGLLESSSKHMKTVQNRLQYLLSRDEDKKLSSLIRTALLRYVQKSRKTVFSEMLVWLFLQEKKFSAAMRQAIALDKRLGEAGKRPVAISKIALDNDDYDVAMKGFEYAVKLGRDMPFYSKGHFGKLNTMYRKVTHNMIRTPKEIAVIEESYLKTLDEFGTNSITINLLKDLAHLQAFYLEKPEEAVALLEKAIKIPRILPRTVAECKIELADIMLLNGNVWDATLYYGQAEKANTENPIGHLAKFKKAKLAFYTGQFEWAKAQLDVLKASTSKLISNDAFEVSQLIADNLAMDSTGVALRLYADSELLLLQHKDSLAFIKLDSILSFHSSHSLVDEVYFRKGELMEKRGKFDEAIIFLKKVVDEFSWDILADDALLKMAEIYHYQKEDTEAAMELYKRILLEYPSSIHVIKSRKRFRKLRGDNI